MLNDKKRTKQTNFNKQVEKPALKKNRKNDILTTRLRPLTRRSPSHEKINVKFHRNQKSVRMDNFQFEEFHFLAKELMKKIKKLLDINSFNQSKTYYELIKLIDMKELKDILLLEYEKRINPKLTEPMLVKTFFIAPFFYNDFDNEELEINKVQLLKKIYGIFFLQHWIAN